MMRDDQPNLLFSPEEPPRERPNYFSIDDTNKALSLCATNLGEVERSLRAWDGYPHPYFLREQLLSLAEAVRFLEAMTHLWWKEREQGRHISQGVDEF